ncbi:MAG: hydrogenase 3 maturation endopeptidase HyCI [Nitrospirota bacterium]
MENIFLPILRGKTVIVGIGNSLRGDDGFGPALIEEIQGKVGCICIDAGSAPEKFLGVIVKEEPDTILFVDAADLDLEPGQYRILEPVDIVKCGLTTHDMSSRMLIEFLENQTKANILMLGVQPQHLSLGEAMSQCLTETLDEIQMLIQEAGSCMRPI